MKLFALEDIGLRDAASNVLRSYLRDNGPVKGEELWLEFVAKENQR